MTRIVWSKTDVISKIQAAIFELEKPEVSPEELMAKALGEAPPMPGGMPTEPTGMPTGLEGTEEVPASLPPMPPL